MGAQPPELEVSWHKQLQIVEKRARAGIVEEEQEPGEGAVMGAVAWGRVGAPIETEEQAVYQFPMQLS